jgi:protein-S-isoprenylcysteine O-methyltransferase Ste14
MIRSLPLSILLAVIALAFYIMNFYLMSLYDSERQQNKRGWSWHYTLQIMAMAVIVVIQPVLWPSLSWITDTITGLIIQILGGIILTFSFCLHVWARRHLGKFYVERVEVQPDHELIDTGPYRFVRHPIITSYWGLASGLLLLNPAITTLLVLAYTIWDFTGSAMREEKLLSNTVTGYREYMNQTPRFLPRFWRNP